MKQITLILVFTFFFLPGLKSQKYFPFPTQNANWNVFYISSCNETQPDTTLLRYTIHGDTTINNTLYRKLCIESGDTANPLVKSIGVIREADKKIYYTGLTIAGAVTGNEYLLYDFTSKTGDTIKHDINGKFYSVVLNTDSVKINGDYRKRYQVDNHWFYQNPDYIIEGIGSVKNGLLGHISAIPTCGYHYWEHVCFRENGVVKYLNPSFNECYPNNLLANIEKIPHDESFSIFPNPVKNNFLTIINKSALKDLRLKLIDMNGRIVSDTKIENESINIAIQTGAGTYYVLITDEQGKKVINKKIVKQ